MQVLIANCDTENSNAWSTVFEAAGHRVVCASTVWEAEQKLLCQRFDLLIACLELGDDSGLSLVTMAGLRTPPTMVLLMTASRTFCRGELFGFGNNIEVVLPESIPPEELLAVGEYRACLRCGGCVATCVLNTPSCPPSFLRVNGGRSVLG
ncbi:response regulator transcription factor [Mesobaculum littorinae]|uniref:Response regulator transcription factor n=1 Tax=Mesobaculum littorinae TaxID=2486419 RepID=A0A438AJ78_9RHOB|nr:response regulator [Mesobaculum littorinae]RVV98675.1 response regulator transcription factor [Mesobaculum littorinae]